MQAARAFGLDTDDLHAPRIPGRDAGDEPSPADRDQYGIELRRVVFPLEPDAALTGDRLSGIIGVDRQRAARCDQRIAGIKRIRIARAADTHVLAVALDARDFHLRGD